MEIMSSWQEHNRYHQIQIPIREHGSTMLSSTSPSPLTHSCIQHPISKLDTLPGIAIKYGVEVADIKKKNGLVTDRQMFGLKTLHIPLPARHPPSNDSGTTGHDDDSPLDSSESFQSLRMQKLSPAMSRLQGGYCGTKLTMKKSISEIFDIAEYGEEASYSSHISDRPLCLSHHRKSKSLANRILDDIMEEVRNGASDKQKNETPELVLNSASNSSNGGFPSRTGKGLAQRQKASSRMTMASDFESSGLRKSSSLSCLQQKDKSSCSSISRKSLKPDLNASSTAKPIVAAAPRNKAALH
ncbi:LysM domain [Sesbania bispinosa]|nr:LysM domain [Sesbania bispinosa]